jgi:very-short-patch-repair endonuclease
MKFLIHMWITYNRNTMIARTLRLRMSYAKKDRQRRMRLLFPSAAEVKFVRILGGKVLTFRHIKHPKTKFPLVIFLSMGRMLRRENVQRETRIGGRFADFTFETPYTKKLIEIDGKAFHDDIIKEQERDDYLRKYGWRVLHVRAVDIWRRPDVVRKRVRDFLAR